jgi:hypothetical protein
VSDIQAVLKLAREAYPQVPDLIEQQTTSLRSYLAGLSPLPPPTLVPLPAFVAHTLPTIKRVDDPIGAERWWRQHLDHVCSVNERLLAEKLRKPSGAGRSPEKERPPVAQPPDARPKSGRRSPNKSVAEALKAAIETLTNLRDWTMGSKYALIGYAHVPKTTGFEAFNTDPDLQAAWDKYRRLRSGGYGSKITRRNRKVSGSDSASEAEI